MNFLSVMIGGALSGVTYTAANVDEAWIGCRADETLSGIADTV